MEHPVSPLNLSIFWIEHVIKYGGDHLKPQAAHMSWIEYYEVKLILIAMLILLSVLATFYLISRLAINSIIKRYKLYIRIKSE